MSTTNIPAGYSFCAIVGFYEDEVLSADGKGTKVVQDRQDNSSGHRRSLWELRKDKMERKILRSFDFGIMQEYFEIAVFLK